MNEWAGWKDSEPVLLGNEETYRRAIEYLDGHGDIVDFGGGTGYAARFVKQSAYSVLDGSPSRFVPNPVDLATVRFECDCLLMRHVLEHNSIWLAILINALESFHKRAVIILFIDLESENRLVRTEHLFIGSIGMTVPTYALSKPLFLSVIYPYLIRIDRVGNETMFFLEKR